MKNWIGIARSLTLLTSLALFVGCQPQGPAERAGESIDDAAQGVQDALDPRGPAEKAGSAVDDAFGN